jgi:hypothetical protein
MLTSVSKSKYEISHRPKSFSWELRFCDGLANGYAEAKRPFFPQLFCECVEKLHEFSTLKIAYGDESSARSGTYPLYKLAEVVAVLSRRCFSVELFARCSWKNISL